MEYADIADEIGPAGMVLLGFGLFVIPEPATSTLGVGLMLLGGAWMFYEWKR